MFIFHACIMPMPMFIPIAHVKPISFRSRFYFLYPIFSSFHWFGSPKFLMPREKRQKLEWEAHFYPVFPKKKGNINSCIRSHTVNIKRYILHNELSALSIQYHHQWWCANAKSISNVFKMERFKELERHTWNPKNSFQKCNFGAQRWIVEEMSIYKRMIHLREPHK